MVETLAPGHVVTTSSTPAEAPIWWHARCTCRWRSETVRHRPYAVRDQVAAHARAVARGPDPGRTRLWEGTADDHAS